MGVPSLREHRHTPLRLLADLHYRTGGHLQTHGVIIALVMPSEDLGELTFGLPNPRLCRPFVNARIVSIAVLGVTSL